jgi:hypothetical protein
MIIAVIPFLDTIFIERFRNSLKIDQIFDDYLLISARFFSSKHSFEVCKQKKVTEDQPWRIRGMGKQFVA